MRCDDPDVANCMCVVWSVRVNRSFVYLYYTFFRYVKTCFPLLLHWKFCLWKHSTVSILGNYANFEIRNAQLWCFLCVSLICIWSH